MVITILKFYQLVVIILVALSLCCKSMQFFMLLITSWVVGTHQSTLTYTSPTPRLPSFILIGRLGKITGSCREILLQDNELEGISVAYSLSLSLTLSLTLYLIRTFRNPFFDLQPFTHLKSNSSHELKLSFLQLLLTIYLIMKVSYPTMNRMDLENSLN